MKKIFIFSSILFVFILGLWGLYNFGFKDSANNPIADPLQKERAKKKESELIVNPDGKLEVLINDTVIGAVLDKQSILYYSTRNNDLRRISLEGKSPEVLYANLPGAPTRLVWSPKRDAVLMLLESPEKTLWHLLTFSDKSLIPLKNEMSNLTWSNVGESIFYQYTDPRTGAVSINISNPDGKNWKKILDVEKGNYLLSPIPRSSLIAFWKHPNGLEQNKLEIITLVGDTKKTLFSGRYGMDILWSKDGSRFLVGSVLEKGKNEMILGIANEQGGEYRSLGVPTLLSKVVWSEDNETIYYALPSPFPKETILPNDYYNKSFTTKDTFWKMNIKSGKRSRLIPLEEINTAVDAIDLFLASDESSLFFTDRMSGKLYRIDL